MKDKHHNCLNALQTELFQTWNVECVTFYVNIDSWLIHKRSSSGNKTVFAFIGKSETLYFPVVNAFFAFFLSWCATLDQEILFETSRSEVPETFIDFNSWYVCKQFAVENDFRGCLYRWHQSSNFQFKC